MVLDLYGYNEAINYAKSILPDDIKEERVKRLKGQLFLCEIADFLY